MARNKRRPPVRRHLAAVTTQAGVPGDLTALVDAAGAVAQLAHLVPEMVAALPESGAVLELFDAAVAVAETDELWAELREKITGALATPTALRAELAGAELQAQFVSDGDFVDEPLVGLLLALAAQNAHPSSMALALVLADSGRSEEVRAAARLAVLRLRLGGVKEPRWSPSIGKPAFDGTFYAASDSGEMLNVVVHFSYSRRPHALVFLLDRTPLGGGGVKDVWMVELRTSDQLRERFLDEGMTLVHLGAPDTIEMLSEALSRQPCPATPEQIGTVVEFMPLALARLRTLAPGLDVDDVLPMSAWRPNISSENLWDADSPRNVLRLKVTLRGVKPAVWREIVVDEDMPVEALHDVLQVAFGWDDNHLWGLTIDGERYVCEGLWEEVPFGADVTCGRALVDLELEGAEQIEYTYDFGDDWVHDIEFVDLEDPQDGISYPHCSDGARPAPPDNSRGLYLDRTPTKAELVSAGFTPKFYRRVAINAQLGLLFHNH